MNDDIFRFKRFSVRHTGATLKVNTDAVLLGALADHPGPVQILDIGTGNGTIALMLAQRFPEAQVHAIEVDHASADIAMENARLSPFAGRMQVFAASFETFFQARPGSLYDMVVCNPPYFLNALVSPAERKNLAKHASAGFFDELFLQVKTHIASGGIFWLIVPELTWLALEKTIAKNGWCVNRKVTVLNKSGKAVFRIVAGLQPEVKNLMEHTICMRNEDDTYHISYRQLLEDFLINF